MTGDDRKHKDKIVKRGANLKSTSMKAPTNVKKKSSAMKTHAANSLREAQEVSSTKKLNKAPALKPVPEKKDDRDKPLKSQQKRAFVDFVEDAFEAGINGILKRYEEQIKPFVPNRPRKAFDENMEKNRYKDVVCVDETRIVLKENESGDYIHANRVEGEPFVNRFICAQAPMQKTVRDFWRMLVQEKVGNIFMLCETVEEGKPKCEQYWPREVGCSMEWPGIIIRNVEVDDSDSTTITTTLEVSYKRADKLTIKHHQWRTWPDKSVPQSVMAPFRLLKISRWAAGPTVVHCSAGIGRTGTVVGLEMAIQMALTGRELRMVDVVQRLRMQRGQAVQTDLQFVYMHKCIIAYLQAHRVFSDNPALLLKTQAFDLEYMNLLKSRESNSQEQLYSPVVPLNWVMQNPVAPACPPAPQAPPTIYQPPPM
ncbi:hypothetical protein L596_018367 [Steinernema carpocapsae]|uniref:Tyrosine-protein phosphatase domain-containing protein n=1 Tax=Steinernema carpocapsae TaxID=34508 RepID=A0A4U5N558_STECR|nr:hypothetical protein L596_018367 [Steinernema carpocapsae]